MTRRERARIAGVRAVISGFQDPLLKELAPEEVEAVVDRELDPLPDGRKRPGEIGGVVVQLSFMDRLSDHPRLFDPDDAA